MTFKNTFPNFTNLIGLEEDTKNIEPVFLHSLLD